ncbi:hypothetical protein OPV22_028243 [Ensete ventricosum]|uniref:Uncharacterized protein n=1 Tax=Ensete ventricosum TaxID=4639 RepID=A0AAV8P4X5_ENSVE|nr:hypothetical protein OPV22_028243 [Ensete ventricosum]
MTSFTVVGFASSLGDLSPSSPLFRRQLWPLPLLFCLSTVVLIANRLTLSVSTMSMPSMSLAIAPLLNRSLCYRPLRVVASSADATVRRWSNNMARDVPARPQHAAHELSSLRLELHWRS